MKATLYTKCGFKNNILLICIIFLWLLYALDAVRWAGVLYSPSTTMQEVKHGLLSIIKCVLAKSTYIKCRRVLCDSCFYSSEANFDRNASIQVTQGQFYAKNISHDWIKMCNSIGHFGALSSKRLSAHCCQLPCLV